MLGLVPQRLDRIVVLGAHCDDIAIGAGATLLRLCRENPGLNVDALVLTGAGTAREEEEHRALALLCPKAEVRLRVLDLPDGRLPVHWGRVKTAVEKVRRRNDPQLILAPAPHDAHQDHHTLARIVPSAFRNHLVMGYEILKFDGDLAQPNAYVPIDEQTYTEKIQAIFQSYRSQRYRSWFDAETFSGLARIRGVQCNARYAEAFHISKFVLLEQDEEPGG